MASHVRILAWINIVMGGLGVLAAVATYAGAAILPQLLIGIAGESGDLPGGLIQIVATVLIAVILVLSLPSLVLGFGLYYHRPWARVLGLVLSAINLVHIPPVGTVVGIYGFWVLLKPESEALFRVQGQ